MDNSNTSPDLLEQASYTLRLNRSLLQAMTNLPRHTRILELETQLTVLDAVLEKLQQVIDNTDLNLANLASPVQGCLNKCEELQRIMSQEESSDFQGWDDNIIDITLALKLFSSTIVVGMIDAEL
jgi:uncharacterized coiled-coil protein SlyX